MGATLLVVALCLPTVRFHAFGSKPEVYSIFGGIEALWEDGNPILATIVFLFSMVFPAVKLALLARVWWRNDGSAASRATVLRLQLLGKWSMLDVLIIGLFVGSIRLGIATAESLPGIHVFTAAILVSMLATNVMAHQVGARHAPHEDPLPGRWIGRALNLAAAVALGVACSSVVLVVKKAFVFSNEVDYVGTTRELFDGHERTLAVLCAVLVLGTSASRTLAAAWVRWTPRGCARARRTALLFDEWAMIDVFALALVIVSVKLDQLATTDLQVGFGATIAAAALAEADAWWLRRGLRSG